MDELRKSYYEMAFGVKYRDTGDSFQDFFSTLMELRYPAGDFVRVRPWGHLGDRKNDGYLRSKRQLFQCFGPLDMKPLTKCIAKIKQDFTGALPHWKQHFDTWIFVHNDPKGLPADVLKTLLDLTQKQKGVRAINWGHLDLLNEFKQLSEQSMAILVGSAPERKDVVAVRVEDVHRLLEHISLQPASFEVDIRPVPSSKLQHNQLSDAAATLLKAGMTRSEVVKKYLRGLADQTRYDRVAAAFKLRYGQFKEEGLAPDEIFAHLQRFVSGDGITSPTHQAATLAILAFFFEACEIFERPPATVNSQP